MRRQEIAAHLKSVLLKRRELLGHTLRHELDALHSAAMPPVGDLGDAALEGDFDEINVRIAELESQELADVEAALERIGQGTFRHCELCGHAIPMARLQAVPHTTLCVRCQRDRDSHTPSAIPGEHWSLLALTLDDDPLAALADEHELVPS